MGRRLLGAVTLLLFLTTIHAAPAPADDGARFLAPASTVDLSVLPLPAGTVSSGAEPDIHVTRDGSVILVGDVSGLYRSTNGGASWSRAPDPFLPGLFADGWAIAEDDAGRIYVSTTQGQIVGVASSANKGASWDITTEIVALASIADRPWLAARGDGEVALVVYGDNGEECWHSEDRGMTWLERSLLTGGSPNAGSLSYDSKGRAWYSNGEAFYRWPNNCSAPFRIDHPDAGAQILTQAAIDGSDRVHTAVPSGNNAQMLIHGWSASTGIRTLAVSQPAHKSNTFGAIAIDNATGTIAVSWYASATAGNPSADSFSGSWHVYVARVTGFWTASPGVTVTQITSVPNHVGGFCMSGIGCTTADRDLLDYHGVAFAPDGAIHVAYGHDGAGSNADVRHAKVS